MTSATVPPRSPTVGRALPPCPYVGLVPFSEDDAEFFFGRENEAELIAANMVTARLTLLYAPSGVGKTSVLRADVVPRLHEIGRGDEDVGIRSAAVVYVSDWSGPPLQAVTEGIQRELLGLGDQIERPALRAPFVPSLQGALARSGVPAVYLILDQFEEYFLYHPVDEDLPRAIGDVLTTRGLNVHLLLSLREDALAGLDRFEGHVPHLFENYLRLSYLCRDSARSAIVGPLDRYNDLADSDARMAVEPELVEDVLNEVRAGNVVLVPDAATDDRLSRDSSDIEAPYLQLVLTRLWDEERSRGSAILRRETLRELGGSQTIVRTHLDSVMANLTPEQRDMAAGVFHHLVTRSGSKIALAAEDLADWAGLPAERIRNVLERLSSGPRRILRPVPPAAGLNGPPRYEVFHDVMGSAVLDWRRRYVVARQQAEAEIKLQQARAAARTARRRLRRARLVAAVMALLLVTACLLGLVAYRSSQAADSALRLAWGRQLAIEAERVVETQPDTAILLGLQSMSLIRDQEPAPEAGLVNGLSHVTHASRQLVGHTRPVLGTTFSPDGALLTTASADSTVRLWDVTTGAPHGAPLTGHDGWVHDVAFSPDGALLATAGSDATVRLWDVATGSPRGMPLTGHDDTVWRVMFSPDGSTLASVSTDAVRLWDVATGASRGALPTGPGGQATETVFSPDGALLATAGNDKTVRLWEVATGSLQRELTGHTGTVWGVAFGPDGRLMATAGADGAAQLWDVATGAPHGTSLAGHIGAVTDVAFSPDGALIVTAGDDGTARLWDVVTGTPRGDSLIGHDNGVWGAAFSPNGALLATAGWDRTVWVWDVATGQPHGQPLTGHSAQLTSLQFSPDSTLIATSSDDRTARLWEAGESPSFSRALTHTSGVVEVAFSPDDRLVAGAGNDGDVRLWDVSTGAPRSAPLTGNGNSAWGIAFSPSGDLLAIAGDDGAARLWDVATGTPHGAPLTGHDGAVNDVAFSPDGTLLATAGLDKTVRLWDVATGTPHGAPLTGHGGVVNDVAFSPDGTLLASAGSEGAVSLWDVAIGAQRGAPLTEHSGAVWEAAFSPDGALLATAGNDGTVWMWDVLTGSPHGAPLAEHTGSVSGVAFSPDGALLATAGEDKTVRLWDVTTGRPRGPTLTGHADAVWGVAFSADGTLLASAGRDEHVRLWNLGFASWHETGCELVNHNLSKDEWDLYASGLPYERTCPNLPSGDGAPPDAPAAAYAE